MKDYKQNSNDTKGYVFYTLLIFMGLMVHFSSAQKRMDSYTATNGVTYNEDDMVTLNVGSGINGTFISLYVGGWATPPQQGLGSGYNDYPLKIKKIKKFTKRGAEKVVFTVGGGNITNYYLVIEDAIRECEVLPCNGNDIQKVEIVDSEDKYDKLAKLKKLFDDGVLSKEEYESEKKKILEQ